MSPQLSDILQEISNGASLYWSILYLDTTGDLGEGKSIPVFQDQIYASEKGIFISWKELNALSQKFWDLMDITLIAVKDISFLHRYNDDKEMFENCDIVIKMIDSSYWIVFSKDEQLIIRLTSKFKEIEVLEPDYKK